MPQGQAVSFRLALDFNRKQSVGRVKAFVGNFGVLVRALAYILAYGPGVRQATEDAVVNANYIRKGLEGVFDLPYTKPSPAGQPLARPGALASRRPVSRERGRLARSRPAGLRRRRTRSLLPIARLSASRP